MFIFLVGEGSFFLRHESNHPRWLNELTAVLLFSIRATMTAVTSCFSGVSRGFVLVHEGSRDREGTYTPHDTTLH